jgi:hypothetical protein
MLVGGVYLRSEDEYIVLTAYVSKAGPVSQLVAGFCAAVFRHVRWRDHDFHIGPVVARGGSVEFCRLS